MDLFAASLILGGTGLAAMAVTGLSHQAHAGGHGHASGHGGHAHGSGHGHGGAGAHGHATHAGSHSHGGGHGAGAMQAATWMLMSPRYLFSGLLGFGMAGILLRTWFGGAALVLLAIAGGIAVERLLVNPLWSFALRFASNPASTLETMIESEAVAVSNFDRNGQGIIAVEVDGQVQQVLATLAPADRAAGSRVRAGQRVRIDEVDGERQRCRVSLL